MQEEESIELRDERYSGEELTKRYMGGSKMRIEQEKGRGRFVVASLPIASGSIVMDALPYAFAVDDELKHLACAYCLQPSVKSMEKLLGGSIASVDAVLFNERLEAGDSLDQIQDYLQKIRSGDTSVIDSTTHLHKPNNLSQIQSHHTTPSKSRKKKRKKGQHGANNADYTDTGVIRDTGTKEGRKEGNKVVRQESQQTSMIPSSNATISTTNVNDIGVSDIVDDVPLEEALNIMLSEQYNNDDRVGDVSVVKKELKVDGDIIEENVVQVRVEDGSVDGLDKIDEEEELEPWKISCSDCKQVYYCSQKCCESDAPMHVLQCGALKKLNNMSWPSFDLTMARMILHLLAHKRFDSEVNVNNLMRGGVEYASKEAREQLARFRYEFDVMSLVSNEKEIEVKTLTKRRALVKFIKGLGMKYPDLFVKDVSEIVRLIGKVDQNTFGVRYDRNLSYAFGMFPSMSYFNHSCEPNVCVIQHNTVLKLISLRDIQPGEEIAISYIETDRPTVARRKCLMIEYNFLCSCPRCLSPPSSSSSSDYFITHFICKNPQCDGKGLLIPLHPSQTSSSPLSSSSPSQNPSFACNICQSSLIIHRNR